jgi:hypothetical protein
MPNTALNRTTQTLMTNKSGGSVAYGGVVIVDTTTDSSFTTTTTSGISTAQVGIVLEPNGIANNALGMVAVGGWCPRITLNTASTRGQFIKTHTVAGQGTPHSSPQVEGDFAVALEASTTPACNLFGSPNGPLTGGAGTVTHTAGALTANAVVIGNASADVTVLAALGTSGWVLTSAGAGAPPSFQALPSSGALVLLEQHTGGGTTYDFTTFISSTYDTYQFQVLGLIPQTSTASFQLQFGTGGGPTWDSGSNYSYAYTQNSQIPNGANLGSAAATAVFLGNSLGTGSTKGASGSIYLYSPQDTSLHKPTVAHLTMTDSSGNFINATTSGLYLSTTAVTGIRFSFSSGNITSGTIRVYGLTK